MRAFMHLLFTTILAALAGCASSGASSGDSAATRPADEPTPATADARDDKDDDDDEDELSPEEQVAQLDRLGTYIHMIDNAILEDMALFDFHFVPNRARLNALGQQRVERLADLIELYGGQINLSSMESDETLLNARLAEVREYLSTCGADVGPDSVMLEQAGGRGISSKDAIFIRQARAFAAPTAGNQSQGMGQSSSSATKNP
jgi:hypothetical protein